MFICLSMSNYDKRSDVNEVHDCGERMIVKRGERRARRVPCREAFQLSSNSVLTLFLLITVMMVMYSVHIILSTIGIMRKYTVHYINIYFKLAVLTRKSLSRFMITALKSFLTNRYSLPSTKAFMQMPSKQHSTGVYHPPYSVYKTAIQRGFAQDSA